MTRARGRCRRGDRADAGVPARVPTPTTLPTSRSRAQLPQIFAIVSARSGEGLSLSMFEIETLCYSLSLGYAFRSGLPFNAWGETAFIAVQVRAARAPTSRSSACRSGLLTRSLARRSHVRRAVPSSASRAMQSYIIVMLLHMYAGAKGSSLRAIVMAVGLPVAAYAALKPDLITDAMLETLYSSQNALLLAARLPQVYANFANGSTGQLSLVTIALMVAGGIVRMFTTVGSTTLLRDVTSSAQRARMHSILVCRPLERRVLTHPRLAHQQPVPTALSLVVAPADAGGRQQGDAHGVRPGHRDQRHHGAADRLVHVRRRAREEEEGRVEEEPTLLSARSAQRTLAATGAAAVAAYTTSDFIDATGSAIAHRRAAGHAF